MKIPSDPARRVSLPGVGEVPRPVDIDQRLTGFEHLVSLRIYEFSQGQTIDGEAEDDEVGIVFLSGQLSVAVSGEMSASWEVQGRQNVFSGPPYAVYLPPHHSYRLTLHTDAVVAYARAKAEGQLPPRLIQAEDVPVQESAEGQSYNIVVPKDAERLHIYETLTPSGGWDPFPPYKHDTASSSEEALEELAHYRLRPAHGSALGRIFDSDGETTLNVTDGDTVAVKHGYHTVAAPPDGQLYGLHVLAGPKP